MTPSTTTPKSASKTAKQSRMVILRLRADLLAKVSPPSTTADTASASNDTPLPSVADGTPVPDGRKSATKPGMKRTSSAALLDAANKGKGRPGPKKKPRLADGTIDRSQDTPKPAAAAPANPAHKLGPKANTGAINAHLRALDRTGKPCRKWERSGFNLKSFTGIAWGVGSWSAPSRDSSSFAGDVKSDSSSMGDVKATMESSAIPSESSRNGDLAVDQPNGVASSPAPIVA